MTEGTIHASASFDEERYVHELEKALSTKHANHDAIIDYLVKINNAQRQMHHFNKDLEEALLKELKGELETVIISLLQTPPKVDAIALQKAVKGLGTDENVLIEILATRSNEEIEAARNVFYSLYKRTLEDAITADTSGDFRSFLLLLCRGRRDESTHVDVYSLREIATQLHNGINKKEHFEKELSGDVKDLALALVQVARNKPLFFANQIQKSVKGFGTRDNDLIRILVSRSEIDLEVIKGEYERAFGKSLLDTIKGETKGDYKNALVALIVGNKKL